MMPEMSEYQMKMLRILAGKLSPFSTGNLGLECWGTAFTMRSPRTWALPASNVLKALRRRGYVRNEALWGHVPSSIGWVITQQGREAM